MQDNQHFEAGVRDRLTERVVQAAEAALADHPFVSAIDVLCGIGWLAHAHLDDWRKGRIGCLEEGIQTNLRKIARSMEIFHRWAIGKSLKPSETIYSRHGRNGKVNLQFSLSGNPEIEKSYRTHYVSPSLSKRKQASVREKSSQTPQPVVFQVMRDTQCGECGAAIDKDMLLMMDAGEPLCLACARLEDLEYLPAGDTALTRRAGKYSERSAVVVRFSRSRKRYERQGILVERSALEKAEHECTEDADERAAAREHAAKRRLETDQDLVVRMAERIAALFPGCPPSEAVGIARHTAQRGSGRVGRTEAGRKLDAQALSLAVAAAVRHQHTNYDDLLASGMDRVEARSRVAERIESILDGWRKR
jgi:hypothetical protein